MVEEEQDNEELNKILEGVEEDNNVTESGKLSMAELGMLNTVVIGISAVCSMVSDLTGLQSIKLNDKDRTQLSEALKPLMPELLKYAYLFKYLPIVIFAFGISARAVTEVVAKRKQKKKLVVKDGEVEVNVKKSEGQLNEKN